MALSAGRTSNTFHFLSPELLKRTAEKKDERRQERLNDYYKRNFKEYFDFEAGNRAAGKARGISEETNEKIMKWLEDNK